MQQYTVGFLIQTSKDYDIDLQIVKEISERIDRENFYLA